MKKYFNFIWFNIPGKHLGSALVVEIVVKYGGTDFLVVEGRHRGSKAPG